MLLNTPRSNSTSLLRRSHRKRTNTNFYIPGTSAITGGADDTRVVGREFQLVLNFNTMSLNDELQPRSCRYHVPLQFDANKLFICIEL